MKNLALTLIMIFTVIATNANTYNANSSNYTTYLSMLSPGDTLNLAAGNYTNRLNIFSMVGTATNPIVIIGSGNSTVFLGNACCNTVSIKKSAYVILKNFKLDGQDLEIDGIKAEGTTGNWAHHITIENITIVNHGYDQLIVGISTKCPAWDWIVRGCTIDGAGTGMYFGNSNGKDPFVNGIIENNLVKNTLGYSMQIKHQNVNLRNIAGMTLNGKTIIRNNVFSKQNNSSSGGSARPNLLVGNFPATGDGVNDYYEIYGNFLWQNPYESLFQGTGNIIFYDNVGVNYAGGSGIAIQNHNGFQPRDIKIFNNTIVSDDNWGIRLMNTDPTYQKYVYGNAVFSDHATPIRIVGGGVSTANLSENITDIITNANNYVNDASNNISTLDLYPSTGSALNSTLIPNTLFSIYTDYDKDFNSDSKNWRYRGAYSGEGTNPGWHLAIEIKPDDTNTLGISGLEFENMATIYPNPSLGIFTIDLKNNILKNAAVFTLSGQQVMEATTNEVNISNLSNGIYFVKITSQSGKTVTRKIIKN
ncbi:MAG: T9SS type A sorting domain-containing protein [Flavobacteriaceae bacterium]|nr:T9SS type A sorting domain-containing protein [Flavobacteriaceae bacterium]